MTVAALALGGCNLAPTYQRPAAPVASTFTSGEGQGLAAADRGWRDVFGDPRLQTLISIALQNNRDLRIAALNVEAAQAAFRIERSAQAPRIDATGTGTVAGTEEGVSSGFGAGGFTQYRVGLSMAAFEIDLFGRVRNLKEAALQEYLATAEAQRATHLALVSQVVAQYLRERAYAEQLAMAERMVELTTESFDITRRLFDAGQRSELDLRTAEAQVQGQRAEVIRLTRARQQAENALVLLIGQPLPENLPPAQPLESQEIVADLPAGVPSEVLLRRPDILAAEHVLRAANADIGAARAAFFPSISLTAFAGVASQTLSGLFSNGLSWSFSPQIAVPIFNYGRNRAALDLAKVRKRIEIARYERAIQVAFREVADALVARATLDQQLEAQVARAQAEQKRFELSESRYKSGIESFLTVLQAQRDLYTTQLQLVELRLQRLVNLADLYVALGGGWRERSGSAPASASGPSSSTNRAPAS